MHDRHFYLAEFNIARLKAPLDDPGMKEFVDFLEPVNRFGEQSPGFVWRLVAPGGQSSTYLSAAYADPMIVPNLTVWQDIDSLTAFVYHTVHAYFLRNRKQWFDHIVDQRFVLWWIDRDHRPTLEEGKQKLLHLQAHGPTSQAFTLQVPYDSAGNRIEKS
jgi:Domain of unknown function (DUF3291)